MFGTVSARGRWRRGRDTTLARLPTLFGGDVLPSISADAAAWSAIGARWSVSVRHAGLGLWAGTQASAADV